MLGIIGAMDEEVAKIKEQLRDVEVETRAAMDFYIDIQPKDQKM